ncbi:precorrin-2 C(20)-methyltransferase [Agrobacterium vitis]|uniref:Precorrin-2 C(20)-methyltransferase n=1 Tax=Agrobacterium vitis TaxID=373 RepID=A0ABD6G6P6_AGRVI|nr:precorrin-2 C(20)-methyltransferase [Agrobacterium vitis]MUO77836.1 precorrin-2 C(20)-methyltransferase [Agrobacterium vitis]MUO93354.1 precorrin-2 C(20)-methyltransferase [Agrobacterium vitis]MUP04705.1 precorrin-2 C(20)-methyltransferase [Agrobacterium vitis]MUZ80858.1 precorrin-2 C(20)-methyltransferase [Agrobacterium vitis]MVA08957.1 precorrin-2 C(20)-methyltransferase [Agrobacterium vitis]
MTGKLYGLGLGPGDPELMTLKAHRILTSVSVIAYPAPDTGPSFARQIAAPYLRADQLEVPMIVPMRVERYPAQEIYDAAAVTLSHHLDAGSDVAVLCEGDPFFYGSFMYLFERLAHRYPTEVVPGVSSMMAAAAAYGRPLAARNDVLTVLPGPLEDDVLRSRIESASAVAIIKLGRHFPRIRALIDAMGLTANAGYVERVSLQSERLLPLGDVAEYVAPYFSMILIYKGAEGWALSAAPQTERL